MVTKCRRRSMLGVEGCKLWVKNQVVVFSQAVLSIDIVFACFIIVLWYEQKKMLHKHSQCNADATTLQGHPRSGRSRKVWC